MEMTFGKDIKVHKALIKDLESLPSITSIHKIRDIHEFYSKLSRTVRTVATMKRLQGAQSYVYSIMDKLGPVRETVAQKDDDWEEWGLEELVENLRRYTDRNAVLPTQADMAIPGKKTLGDQGHEPRRRDKILMTGSSTRQQQNPPACVYCNMSNHRSWECTKVLDIAGRREALKRNKLCYNCTKFGHMASQCRSRVCGKCNGRHHTSLCDKITATLPHSSTREPHTPSDRFYGALEVHSTLHATVVAKVNGIPARIMLDSGAGSSYISANLLTKLNLKSYRVERRIIEQMYGTVNKQVEIYKVRVNQMSFMTLVSSFSASMHRSLC